MFKTAEPLKDPRQLKHMKQRNKACCPHEEAARGKAMYEDEDPAGQQDDDRSCGEKLQAFVMSGTFTGIIAIFLLMDLQSMIWGGSGDDSSFN